MYRFSKYHGAGNDFMLADNRDGSLSLSPEAVRRLCDRHIGFGADGVMLLESSGAADFKMVFYNPDGSGGMMCGNGGRCIVSFAADQGMIKEGEPVAFEAPDGIHHAEIIPPSPAAKPVEVTSAGVTLQSLRRVQRPKPEPQTRRPSQCERTVRLEMRDVSGVLTYSDATCFLNTGTRHLVKFVRGGLDEYPVSSEGAALRNDPRFAPAGTNVNFVEPEQGCRGNVLRIRTFEKGVEGETLACGTGIVASAIAAYSKGIIRRDCQDGPVSCVVRAAIADLTVDFVPEQEDGKTYFRDIWLTGPVNFVGTLEIML